jgi:hypothetical protein
MSAREPESPTSAALFCGRGEQNMRLGLGFMRMSLRWAVAGSSLGALCEEG